RFGMRFSRLLAFALPVLIASGVAQQLQISPSTLNFKNQVLNTTSASQIVTLTNSGNSSITVSSIVPSGMYNETNDCTVLNSGQNCTIDVTFTPSTIGTTNGAVTITSSAHAGPQSIGISGIGVGAVKVSPATLNFGPVGVGTSSPPQQVKLTNQQATAV